MPNSPAAYADIIQTVKKHNLTVDSARRMFDRVMRKLETSPLVIEDGNPEATELSDAERFHQMVKDDITGRASSPTHGH